MQNKGGEALNRKEKEKIKKKLLEEKEEILIKLSEFRNEGKEIGPEIAQDPGDRAESTYEKEFIFELSDAERRRLLQIDKALKKIEEDDFGRCESCHKEISKKRLDAIPWTPFCIKCQEKQERKHQ